MSCTAQLLSRSKKMHTSCFQMRELHEGPTLGYRNRPDGGWEFLVCSSVTLPQQNPRKTLPSAANRLKPLSPPLHVLRQKKRKIAGGTAEQLSAAAALAADHTSSTVPAVEPTASVRTPPTFKGKATNKRCDSRQENQVEKGRMLGACCIPDYKTTSHPVNQRNLRSDLHSFFRIWKEKGMSSME